MQIDIYACALCLKLDPIFNLAHPQRIALLSNKNLCIGHKITIPQRINAQPFHYRIFGF